MTPPPKETVINRPPHSHFSMSEGELVAGNPELDQRWDTAQERLTLLTGQGLDSFVLRGLPKADAVKAAEDVFHTLQQAVETFYGRDYSDEQRAIALGTPRNLQRELNGIVLSAAASHQDRELTPREKMRDAATNTLYARVQPSTVQTMLSMDTLWGQALQGQTATKDGNAHKTYAEAREKMQAVLGKPLPETIQQLPTPLSARNGAIPVEARQRFNINLDAKKIVATGAAVAAFATMNATGAAAVENNTASAQAGNRPATSVSRDVGAVAGGRSMFPETLKSTTPAASPNTAVTDQQPAVLDELVPIPPAESGTTLEEQLVPIPNPSGNPEQVPMVTPPEVTTPTPETTPPSSTKQDKDPGIHTYVGNQRDIDPGIAIPEVGADPRTKAIPGETASATPGTAEPAESSQTLPDTQTPVIEQVGMPQNAAPQAQANAARIPQSVRAGLSTEFTGFVDSLAAAAATDDPSVIVPGIPESRKADPATQALVDVFAAATEGLLNGDDAMDYLFSQVETDPVVDALAQNANLTLDPGKRLSPGVERGMAIVLTELATLANPEDQVAETPAPSEAAPQPGETTPATPETPVPTPEAPTEPAEPVTPPVEAPVTPPAETPAVPPAEEAPVAPESTTPRSEIIENTDGYKEFSLDDVRPFPLMEYTNINGAIKSGSLEKLFEEPKAGVNYDIKDAEITKKLKVYTKLYEAIITGNVEYIKEHEDLLMNLNDEQIQRVNEALQENYGDVLKADEKGNPVALGSKQKVTFARWYASTHSYIASINPLGENGIIPEPEPVVPLPIPDIPKQETPPPTEEAPAPTPETPEPQEGGGNTDKDDIYESLENLGTYSYKDGVRKADWDDIAFLYKYLMKNKKIDFKQHHAVGLLANCVAESSCDPGNNQDGGPAAGAFMWEDRLPALKEFAKEQGLEWDSWKAQSLFLIHEFLTSESGALEKLLAADTAEEAALMVSKYYERPGTPHNDVRVGIAKELEKIIAKTKRDLKDSSRGDGERDKSSEENKVTYVRPVQEGPGHTLTCGLNGYDNPQEDGYHTGVDFDGSEGDPVNSPAEGKVIEVGFDGDGAGNYIIIEHPDGRRSVLMHNKKVIKKEGESVQAGDQVAEMGDTGRSFGVHSHWSLMKEGVTDFPWRFDKDIRKKVEDPQKFYN